MKGAAPAVGNPGDIKFVVLNLEVAEKFGQEFWKDFGAALLEEQLAIGRGRHNYDVTSAFRLLAPVPFDSAFDSIHGLGTTGKREHRRICLRWIEAVRKNDLVMDCGSGDILGLIQHFCSERTAREYHSRSGRQEPGPSRTSRYHRSAPQALWLLENWIVTAMVHSSQLKHTRIDW